jgi:Fe-S cluster assembly protein SufD
MSATLAKRIAEEHAAIADQLPSSVSGRAHRRDAIQALLERGLPVQRDENWKYANLRPLERLRFAPATPEARIAVADLPPAIKGYTRYVFVDGLFAPELSGGDTPCAGVTFRSLGSAPEIVSFANNPTPPQIDTAFALLNEAFAADGAHISVAGGSQNPACVELVFVATADAKNGASYPRLSLHVEPRARMGLIERHLSLGSPASFVNASVHVAIHSGATVDHYRVQQAGAQAFWMDTLSANVATDATYRLYAVDLGAQTSRTTAHIHLTGERAQLGLHAVSLADRSQVHDTYALVDHTAPYTRTDETFRGIASGRSRVAFNGKVIGRERARGTDSRQSLRGLLAGKEAEIDVRPQLEIYTDDVKCSHGATAGKLDDTMLFYLLSRGIDRETAQRLLKWAFLEDVVAKIAVPELRKQIELSLAGQLEDASALKEML